MISLIVPIKDNLEFTKKAYSSIRKNTECDYELIFVDNGSAEDTAQFLETTDAVVIRNSENLGCAKAWNQGLKVAMGEYVCILNNDIEVPQGWLKRFKEFHDNHNFAWVSPMMKEGKFNYPLDEYNREFHKRLNGAYFEDEYNAVALFSKRNLYEKVGLFDENYQFGIYEDEDMFWNLRESQLKSAITSTVLLHHYGRQTVNNVKKEKPDFEIKNRRYFLKKWRRIYLKRKLRKFKLKTRHARLNRLYRFHVDKKFSPTWI
ncbi:glycosyltransferase family 2 protein [Bdellovibrionota bacterium]